MPLTVTHNGANPMFAGVLDFSVNFKLFDEGDGRITVSILDCGSPLATPSASPSACAATPSQCEETPSESESPTPSQCEPTPSECIETPSQTEPTPSECVSTPWQCEASQCRPTWGVPPSDDMKTGDLPSHERPTSWTSPLDPTPPTPSHCEETPSACMETPDPICCDDIWDCDDPDPRGYCEIFEPATFDEDCDDHAGCDPIPFGCVYTRRDENGSCCVPGEAPANWFFEHTFTDPDCPTI